jgi:hypothetical protein
MSLITRPLWPRYRPVEITLKVYGENLMATYSCPKCDMSVNATCGKCDAPLVNDSLTKADGTSVQVSKCPNDHGKIKSPMCCGQDMSCSLG